MGGLEGEELIENVRDSVLRWYEHAEIMSSARVTLNVEGNIYNTNRWRLV